MSALKLVDVDNKTLSKEIHIILNNYFDSNRDQWASRRALCIALSKEMEVSHKTIERIFNGKEFKPEFNSVMKLLMFVFETKDTEQLIKIGPSWLKNYLNFHKPGSAVNNTAFQNERINQYLYSNELAMSIYLYVSIDGKHLEDIQSKFGQYGFDELFRMVEYNMLSIDSNRLVSWNPTSQVSLNPEAYKNLSSNLLKKFFRSEEAHIPDQNFIRFEITKVSNPMKLKIMKEYIEFDLKIRQLVARDDEENKFTPSQQTEKLFLINAMDKIS